MTYSRDIVAVAFKFNSRGVFSRAIFVICFYYYCYYCYYYYWKCTVTTFVYISLFRDTFAKEYLIFVMIITQGTEFGWLMQKTDKNYWRERIEKNIN